MALSEDSHVLVTGGCGFIGVNLADELRSRGCRLTAFDDLSTSTRSDGESAGYSVVVGDIRDRDEVFEVMDGVDHVVHLAAHTSVVDSIADPTTDVEVNVGGTLNVLEAARSAGVKSFVFASSNAPLGEIEPPSHENRVPHPLSPYGASKLAGEALCSAYAGSFGLATTVLRFSNVYGPFSYHKGSVVAAYMKSLMMGEPLIVYGDGNQTRDFIYVGDLVKGVVQVIEADAHGEVFHLGTGVETSVNALVSVIRKCAPNRHIAVESRPARAGEIIRNYSDITKAKSSLGFDPRVSIEEGIGETLAWFERTHET